jgi:hypothetical protein
VVLYQLSYDPNQFEECKVMAAHVKLLQCRTWPVPGYVALVNEGFPRPKIIVGCQLWAWLGCFELAARVCLHTRFALSQFPVMDNKLLSAVICRVLKY